MGKYILVYPVGGGKPVRVYPERTDPGKLRVDGRTRSEPQRLARPTKKETSKNGNSQIRLTSLEKEVRTRQGAHEPTEAQGEAAQKDRIPSPGHGCKKETHGVHDPWQPSRQLDEGEGVPSGQEKRTLGAGGSQVDEVRLP